MDSTELVDDMFLTIAQNATYATRIMLRLTCRKLYKQLAPTLRGVKTPSCCGCRPLLTSLIAYDGSFDLLQDVVAHGCRPNGQTCVVAARNGDEKMLKWLRKLPECTWKGTITEKITRYAARKGHLRILKWGLRHINLTTTIGQEAARGGQLQLLKWLLWPRYMPWNSQLIDGAARGGQKEMLAWLVKRFGISVSSEVFVAAVYHGDIEFLAWLRDFSTQLRRGSCPWDATALTAAIETGRITIISWLLDKGCPCNGVAAHYAAEAGRLDILTLLATRSVSIQWPKCFWHAGKAGHIEVLEWMIQYTQTSYPDAWEGAAKKGRTDVLLWALEKGHKFTEKVAIIAASENYLNIIELLFTYNQPLPSNVLDVVAGSDNVNFVEALLSQDYKLTENAKVQNLEVAKLLYAKGASFIIRDSALRKARTEWLQWKSTVDFRRVRME